MIRYVETACQQGIVGQAAGCMNRKDAGLRLVESSLSLTPSSRPVATSENGVCLIAQYFWRFYVDIYI
jgi:hypothetical protein